MINKNVVRGPGIPNYSNALGSNQQMYLDNKYTNLYNNIIAAAKERSAATRKEATELLGYVENHHIIPESLGGDNDRNNLVFLTAREHLICHRLLVKMTTGTNRGKMIFALRKMLISNKFQKRTKVSSRLYAYVRSLAMELKGTNHYNYGKTRTEKWRRTRSKMYSGEGNPNFGKRYKITDTTNYNNAGSRNPMFGKKHSEDTIVLLKHRAQHREKKECPYCHIIVDVSNYVRWHGYKCRAKKD